MQRQHRSHIEELKSNLKPPASSSPEETPETLSSVSSSEDIQTRPKHLPVTNGRILDEIREDIVNLSEKFSKKCVEAAAVQERLYATQKQLQKANTQV